MPRFERIIFYLALICLVLLPFAFARTWIGGLYLSPAVFLLSIAFYLLVIRSLYIKTTIKYPKLVAWASLGFVMALMLSIIGRPNPHWQEVIAFIFYLTIPFLMSSMIRDFNVLRKAVWILILVGLTFALIGDYRFFTGRSPWFEVVNHYESFGTRNSDVFMLESAFILLFSFYLLGKPKSGFLKLAILLALSMMGIGIIFSFSRGAWVSTFIGALSLFILAPGGHHIVGRFLNPRCLLSLGIFILVVISLITFVVPKENIHQEYSRLLTLRSAELGQISPPRSFQWQSSLEMVSNHPIRGIGVGNFTQYILSPPFNSPVPWSDPHNSYLQAWVEEGILGLLAMITLVWSPMIHLKRVTRAFGTREGRWMLSGILATMITYAVHLFFSAFFGFIFFWIIYGLAVSAIICAQKELRNG